MSPQTDALPAPRQRAFTSFANRDFRIFFCAASAAIMADNTLDQLPSAARLMATGRYLAFLLGPTNGIFINALIYVPMVVWLLLVYVA